MQIRVHIPSQTLDLLDDQLTLRQRFAISTSQFGTGFEPGSHRTPTGRFRVCEKIGDHAPEGEIFVGRIPTGRLGVEGEDGDHVQTRILWLEGLEPENANTKARYIYIHGTNWEQRLGTPASHGCVRMSNAEVRFLFEQIEVGTLVEIVDDPASSECAPPAETR